MKKISIALLSSLFAVTMVRGSWAITGGVGEIKEAILPAMNIGIPQNQAINATALPEGFLNNEGNLGNAIGDEKRELPLISQEVAVKVEPAREAKIGATISHPIKMASLFQKSTRRLTSLGAMFTGKTPSQNANAESLAASDGQPFDASASSTKMRLGKNINLSQWKNTNQKPLPLHASGIDALSVTATSQKINSHHFQSGSTALGILVMVAFLIGIPVASATLISHFHGALALATFIIGCVAVVVGAGWGVNYGTSGKGGPRWTPTAVTILMSLGAILMALSIFSRF